MKKNLKEDRAKRIHKGKRYRTKKNIFRKKSMRAVTKDWMR
jgi:hypothetical protein